MKFTRTGILDALVWWLLVAGGMVLTGQFSGPGYVHLLLLFAFLLPAFLFLHLRLHTSRLRFGVGMANFVFLAFILAALDYYDLMDYWVLLLLLAVGGIQNTILDRLESNTSEEHRKQAIVCSRPLRDRLFTMADCQRQVDTGAWMTLVCRGSWLYGGEARSSIRIFRGHVRFGTGDYEDSPDIREDRREETYTVWYESPPGSEQFPAGGGQFRSLEDAVASVEKNCGSTVNWETT